MEGLSRRVVPLFAYEAQGPDEAPWITFIPGIGNDRSFWRQHANALALDFKVLIFDPWGHGDSPPPPDECGFDDMISGLIQLWDQQGIERSSVVGLGFGGSIALATAIAHKGRVDRVVACCCRPRLPEDRRVFWRERLEAAARVGMAAITDMTVDRWLSAEFRVSHPNIDFTLRQAMRRTTLAGYQAYVSAFVEMDFAARLAEIRCPVQLVAAAHDHGGGPVEAMEEMAAVLPNAKLAIIPNSGHICVAEAPEELARILKSFFSSGKPTGQI